MLCFILFLTHCTNFNISDFSDLVSNTSSKSPSDMIAYDKNGLKITFKLESFQSIPNTTEISIEARNNSTLPITEFLFQAAVPKVCLLF